MAGFGACFGCVAGERGLRLLWFFFLAGVLLGASLDPVP